MHRRRFLHLSVAALASPSAHAATHRAETPRPLALSPRRQIGRAAGDVIVVGAGLAGLRTAMLLRQAGRRAVVLEASQRPGGRVRTVRAPFDDGLLGEAGAIRFPPQHRRVQQLAQAFGLPVVPFVSTNGSAIVRAAGVVARTPEDVERLALALDLRAEERGLTQGGLLERYAGATVEAVAARPDDPAWLALDRVTWPAWLATTGASPGAVTLMTLGGDSRDLSALYVLRQFAPLRETSQYYKIHGGMDQLPSAMADQLGETIRYGTEVVRIAERPGGVTVACRQGGRRMTFDGAAVVLAVPCPLLSRLELSPALPPTMIEAVAALRAFPAVRLIVQARERFWHQADLNGVARTDDPAEFWDASYDLPSDRGLLAMTMGGELGRAMSRVSRDEAIRQGVALARRTFSGLSSYYEKAIIYRWPLDPWARGAFTVFHPGGASATMRGTWAPAGRLHVAGEFASSWPGWMEGALESAERVAGEVLGESVERRDVAG